MSHGKLTPLNHIPLSPTPSIIFQWNRKETLAPYSMIVCIRWGAPLLYIFRPTYLWLFYIFHLIFSNWHLNIYILYLWCKNNIFLHCLAIIFMWMMIKVPFFFYSMITNTYSLMHIYCVQTIKKDSDMTCNERYDTLLCWCLEHDICG